MSSFRFVESIETTSPPTVLPVRIVPATPAYATWWAIHVQSEIQKDPTRVDRSWNWLELVLEEPFIVKMARRLGQKPRSFCIVTEARNGLSIPIAMLLLVEEYKWVLDKGLVAPFIWYLAGAPTEFLKRELPHRPRLLSALIDIGIVVSFKNDCQGRIALHADPKGGEQLESAYANAGLLKLSCGDAKLTFGRRIHSGISGLHGDTGNYFFSEGASSQKLLAKLDHLRESRIIAGGQT